MKYLDGQEVKVGDEVKLWGNCHGIVVASFDTHEFSRGYEDWATLEGGILVVTKEVGPVKIDEPIEELVLIRRSPAE